MLPTFVHFQHQFRFVCTCLGTCCLLCQGLKEGALVSPRDLPLRLTNKQTLGYLAGRHGPLVSGAQARQRANGGGSIVFTPAQSAYSWLFDQRKQKQRDDQQSTSAGLYFTGSSAAPLQISFTKEQRRILFGASRMMHWTWTLLFSPWKQGLWSET